MSSLLGQALVCSTIAFPANIFLPELSMIDVFEATAPRGSPEAPAIYHFDSVIFIRRAQSASGSLRGAPGFLENREKGTGSRCSYRTIRNLWSLNWAQWKRGCDCCASEPDVEGNGRCVST